MVHDLAVRIVVVVEKQEPKEESRLCAATTALKLKDGRHITRLFLQLDWGLVSSHRGSTTR